MITLRALRIEDLEEYKYWKLPFHKYHLLNGPYFKKDSENDIEKQMIVLKTNTAEWLEFSEKRMVILNTEKQIIGEVSWYWKSKETNWMEVGIVIFNEAFWNKGIGYLALKLWITYVFEEKKDIVRLGITTWSGNQGMIRLAKKMGMKNEATYRKARIINGKYYDSVSYGVLREEWRIENGNL